MSDIDTSPVSELTGRTVIDPDGDKVGKVFDVYIDNQTDQPEWLAITTGLFGTKVSFAPIAGAALVDDDLQIGYPKDVVKDAPKADADGQLSPDEEAALYAHYGRTGGTVGGSGQPGRAIGGQGRDTSGAETDDAMTRSEEDLDVSTRSEQVGTARLR